MIHIVGGGLQGCFFAIALLERRVSKADIRIYDPNERLLERWLGQTAACNMEFLRSNSSHSIHPRFGHLRDWARARGVSLWEEGIFAQPYHRPRLHLFNQHALDCIREYELEEIHLRRNIHSIRRPGLPPFSIGQASSNADSNCEEILEMGASDQLIYAGGFQHSGPLIPDWVQDVESSGRSVGHLYDSDFADLQQKRHGEILVGGGIGAFQYAIASALQGFEPLLINRHPARAYRFDFNPGFVGPKFRDSMTDAERRGSPLQRMQLIIDNRFSGTVPLEILEQFSELVDKGRARWVPSCDELEIPDRIAQESGDVVLCTGLAHPWVPMFYEDDQAVPTLEGEFPVLNDDLQISRGIFLSGTAAMYRIGPSAPNIIGAHLAWRALEPVLF